MKYDFNGDATFSPAEVKKIVVDMENEKKAASRLWCLVCGLVFALILLIGVMLACSIAGSEATKETHTKGSELVDLNNVPVRTASVESKSTAWDLPLLPVAELAYTKHLDGYVNITGKGYQRFAFKIAGCYKPYDLTTTSGSKTVVHLETYTGHVITIDRVKKSATIQMGIDIYNIDFGPASTRRKDLAKLDGSTVPVRMTPTEFQKFFLSPSPAPEEDLEEDENGEHEHYERRGRRGGGDMIAAVTFATSASNRAGNSR